MHRQLAVCRFSKSEHRRLDGWLVQWTVYLDVCKLLNIFYVAKINCGNGALHRRAQVCGRATRGTVWHCQKQRRAGQAHAILRRRRHYYNGRALLSRRLGARARVVVSPNDGTGRLLVKSHC